MYREKLLEMKQEINRSFIGKEDVTDKVLICLLAEGHVLLEDVPGVGKTTLTKILSKVTGLSFGRIQFTPDTLPGDIVGMSVFNMKNGEFEHRDGVVMNHLLLGDEINRTSPKTQSALLEAMAEGQVSVDGETFMLPKPFMVMATQNPLEFLGTYPLPEAQMDRFMMRLSIGYPSEEQELAMASLYLKGEPDKTVKTVCTPEDILNMQEEVKKIEIKEEVLKYMEEIILLTRKESRFKLGASPRALLALAKAARAHAYLQGREFVKPDDVNAVADHVLAHRLALSADAQIRKENAGKILHSLILTVKVPVL